jgi:hypothetical protein
MLVVNKMDVAGAQLKYDEVKDKLRNLASKCFILLKVQVCRFHFCHVI